MNVELKSYKGPVFKKKMLGLWRWEEGCPTQKGAQRGQRVRGVQGVPGEAGHHQPPEERGHEGPGGGLRKGDQRPSLRAEGADQGWKLKKYLYVNANLRIILQMQFCLNLSIIIRWTINIHMYILMCKIIQIWN